VQNYDLNKHLTPPPSPVALSRAFGQKKLSKEIVRRVRAMFEKHGNNSKASYTTVLKVCNSYINDIKDDLQYKLDSSKAFTFLFYTLLTVVEKRSVFLHMASQKKTAWYLRKVFGSPPYHFLHTLDAQLVDASAISSNRTSMTYNESVRKFVPHQSQFGHPHYTDDSGRHYCLTHPTMKAEYMHKNLYELMDEDLYLNGQIILHVMLPIQRIKATNGKIRQGMNVKFPNKGEKIDLHADAQLCSLIGCTDDLNDVSVVVKQLYTPPSLKRVAMILVQYSS
jgi:hypothetical protein